MGVTVHHCLYSSSCTSGHPSVSVVCPCLLSLSDGWLIQQLFLSFWLSLHVCFLLSIWLTTIYSFLPISRFQINKPLSVGFCLCVHFGYLSVLYPSTCTSSETGSLYSGWSYSHGLADPSQWRCGHEDASFPGGCYQRCTAPAWSARLGAWGGAFTNPRLLNNVVY